MGADFGEAMFTETVTTNLSVVEVLLAASARVNVLLWECSVEREEDDEGDADSYHAPGMMMIRRAFEWYRVRATRNANRKVTRVGRSSKTNTL